MPTDLDGHPLVDGDLTLLPWRDVTSIPGVRDDLVAASNDPEMVRWTTVPHPYTEAHADEFLDVPAPDVARWAYVVDGRYAGNIELRPGGVLGYNTAPWARGRDLTLRAVRLVTQRAIADGVRRLEIHVAEGNVASRSVAQKAGYTYDGFLPEPARQRGYVDELVRYVLLAEAAPKSTDIAP